MSSRSSAGVLGRSGKEEAKYLLRHRWYVFGEVHLWGKVIESARGYRAEFAYPKRILAPRAFAPWASYPEGALDNISSAYGIEVEQEP